MKAGLKVAMGSGVNESSRRSTAGLVLSERPGELADGRGTGSARTAPRALRSVVRGTQGIRVRQWSCVAVAGGPHG